MPPSVNTGSKRPRSRRARGSINAPGILAGAFEFCRDTPVDRLSMPRLAAYPDVGVTSIYWYFKSKRELLDAMAEEALVSFYESMPPLRGDDWEDMLREFFKNFYGVEMK
ncbi:TetR/AcrR family transcriptional regulator [Frankia sp. CcWB2]